MFQRGTVSECQFCTDIKTLAQNSKNGYFQMPESRKCVTIDTLQQSLYQKYSSSQNYYYTKDLNEILNNQRTHATILQRDFNQLDGESEEYLTKLYYYTESDGKLQMLGEYYKYHNDIPRMFMLPGIVPLNWFHDRKRRLEYFRIAKMIDHENNNNPDKPPKGIVGDKPEEARESENVSIPQSDSSDEEVAAKEKILDEISWINQSAQIQKKKAEEQKKAIEENNKELNKFKLELGSKSNWRKPLQLDEQIIKYQQDTYEAKQKSIRTDRYPSFLPRQQEKERVFPTFSKQSRFFKKHKIFEVIQSQQAVVHLRNQSKDSFKAIDSKKPFQNVQTPRVDPQKQSFIKNDEAKCNNKSNCNNSVSQRIASLFTLKKNGIQESIDSRKSEKKMSGSITPRAFIMNNSPEVHGGPLKKGNKMQFKQKLQMLEIKVLTDLQKLQNKKNKKQVTLQLDSVSYRNCDPRSLTQRIPTNELFDLKQKTQQHQAMIKKQIKQRQQQYSLQRPNASEWNSRIYQSGAQSHREPRNSKNLWFQSKEKFHTKSKQSMNISNEQNKQNQMYYQNLQHPINTQIVSQQSQISTFANTNLSSQQNSLVKPTELKGTHYKSSSHLISNTRVQQQLQQKMTQNEIDSQLYKAALNLANKINTKVAVINLKNNPPQSARNQKKKTSPDRQLFTQKHNHQKSDFSKQPKKFDFNYQMK